MLNNKVLFITGGTGSFAKAFVKDVLSKYDVKKIVLYSRCEFKQAEMEREFKNLHVDKLRFILGDIRDKDSLKRAMTDADIVIHTAALKRVDSAEYNPLEFISTNIIGSANVIQCAVENGVEKVVALSTDKASLPATLYGGTKFVADKLFQAGNVYSEGHGIKLMVVRYGNVAGSRGSVIPYFKELVANGEKLLPITHPDMTRFFITMNQALELVYTALEKGTGGEIYVAKIPSFRVTDLVKAFNKECKIVGVRENEKLHESMISIYDYVYEYGNYYIIYPVLKWYDFYKHLDRSGKQKEQFEYSSDSNVFLTVDELKEHIKWLN